MTGIEKLGRDRVLGFRSLALARIRLLGIRVVWEVLRRSPCRECHVWCNAKLQSSATAGACWAMYCGLFLDLEAGPPCWRQCCIAA